MNYHLLILEEDDGCLSLSEDSKSARLELCVLDSTSLPGMAYYLSLEEAARLAEVLTEWINKKRIV